ncbi:MAG TPA: D-aminoacyl-tRNA deacylase [Geopsychrobacteraceae bacterium]|nr:D-aminoacyl-tRNA deacylase [Geopsychrobacteraceae bacterium]
MRAVLQRVSSASVTVDNETIGQIDNGLLVLLGVEQGDTPDEARTLAEKTAYLRIFEDSEGKMNLSVQDVSGAVLAISQFTLLADCRKGRRPGFTQAALPELAEPLYESYVEALRKLDLKVETGRFQADMKVTLINDGPLTMLLDSRKCF